MLLVPYKRSTFSFLLSKSSQPHRRRWTHNPTLRIATIGQVHTEHAGRPGKGHLTHPGGDEAALSRERWVGAEWRRLDGHEKKSLEMRGRAYSAKHRIHRVDKEFKEESVERQVGSDKRSWKPWWSDVYQIQEGALKGFMRESHSMTSSFWKDETAKLTSGHFRLPGGAHRSPPHHQNTEETALMLCYPHKEFESTFFTTPTWKA